MKKIIHKLRKKEQHEKEKIAFLGATVITLFIVLFYLVGITSLNNSVNKNQLANTKEPAENLGDDIKAAWTGIKNIVD